MNKRLKMSGDLLADLFRVNLKVLIGDLLYNFQRIVKRGKFPSERTYKIEFGNFPGEHSETFVSGQEWFHNNDVEIETVKSFKDIPDVVPSEIEDSKDALWAIADDLRERKKSGEFQSFRDAYRWGENNMTQNNKPIKWKSLENAYDKAKAGGKV